MNDKPEYAVESCRGARSGDCPHLVAECRGMAGRVEDVVHETGWPAFLARALGGRHHFHHAFRIALAGCPNGCSRPHIRDLALIRAMRPALDPGTCISCGLCESECPDGAIRMGRVDGMRAAGPVIDADTCLQCGHCVRICPTGALSGAESGWRIVAGGRLGRRPALARELPGVYDDDRAVAVLRRALELHMRHWRKERRFGALLDEHGLDILTQRDG